MELMPLLLFASVIAVLLAGFPVAFSLAGTALSFAVIGMVTGSFDEAYLEALPNRLFGIVINETLVAVPLFAGAVWTTVIGACALSVWPWGGQALGAWAWFVLRGLTGAARQLAQATTALTTGLPEPALPAESTRLPSSWKKPMPKSSSTKAMVRRPQMSSV